MQLTENDTVLIRYPMPYPKSPTFHLAARQRVPASLQPVPLHHQPFPKGDKHDAESRSDGTGGTAPSALLLAKTAALMGLSPGRDFPHLRAICTAGECLLPAAGQCWKSFGRYRYSTTTA